jgi:hypothetical protein
MGRLVPAVAGVACAIAFLLLVQAPSRAATVPLSISIEGNHFVNGAGQTIRLLGVNHASFEYGCVDGFGYNDGHMDDADAAAIASWDATAVRVPLNEDCWLGINGQPNSNEGADPPLNQAGYQQAVKDYVSFLNAHGLYAILDLHWTAPGAQVAEEQQPMPDFDHSPDFWQSVASTFKGNPAVVFDVFNEPYDPTDPRSGDDQDPQDQVTWNCWDTGTQSGPGGGAPCDTSAYDPNGVKTVPYRVAGLQTLVTTIRNTGATQPVLTGGLDYANDLSQWATHAPDDPLNQEAASFHNYQGKSCDNVNCWNSTIAAVAANVPVVTGEFDEDNFQNASCDNKTQSTFDADYMNWADQQGVSYLAWGWEVLSAQEISDQKCSAFYLTSDPAGTPAAPNGTAVHDHLVALAAGGSTGPTPTKTTKTPVKLKGFSRLCPALSPELLRRSDGSDHQQVQAGQGQTPQGRARLGALLTERRQGKDGRPEALQGFPQAAHGPPPAEGADHSHADQRLYPADGDPPDDHPQGAAHSRTRLIYTISPDPVAGPWRRRAGPPAA